ncbi:RICIN domain-containing protein [Actinoplanes sp. NBC_00393]|uniref:RICIN domain-containing protein n=1 Tax=Actinoplanes sp. NBC_00393 TaxID=2975953 RepID=UPI002E1A8C37
MLGISLQVTGVGRRRLGTILAASLITVLSFGSATQAAPTPARQVNAAGAEWVYIINYLTGSVLGVSNSSANNGAPIIQWKREGNQDQAWTFSEPLHTTNTFQSIRNGGTSKWMAMGVSASSTKNGGKIIQWNYLVLRDQMWWLRPAGKNSSGVPYYRIENLNSGKCVGIPNGTLQPVQAIQWTCSDDLPDQWWYLAPWSAQ